MISFISNLKEEGNKSIENHISNEKKRQIGVVQSHRQFSVSRRFLYHVKVFPTWELHFFWRVDRECKCNRESMFEFHAKLIYSRYWYVCSMLVINVLKIFYCFWHRLNVCAKFFCSDFYRFHIFGLFVAINVVPVVVRIHHQCCSVILCVFSPHFQSALSRLCAFPANGNGTILYVNFILVAVNG